MARRSSQRVVVVRSAGRRPSSDVDVRAVLESGIREISGEVRNSLDFHRSQEGGGEVSHVVLSGAAQDIPGFAEALQASLGVEVRSDDGRTVADEHVAGKVSTHRLAVADRPRGCGGAAMRAVNLIPRRSARALPSARAAPGRRLRGARRSRLVSRCSRCSTASRPAPDLRAVARRRRRSPRRRRARRPRQAQLAPYTSFIALRQQRMQAVEQLVDSRFDWAHAFHEFGRVLPLEVSITSLHGTVGSRDRATRRPVVHEHRQPHGAAAGTSVALGHAPGQRPDVHSQRLRDQPVGWSRRCSSACA